MDPLTRLRPDGRDAEQFAQLLERTGRDTGSSQSLVGLAHLADRLADTGRSLERTVGPSTEFRDGLRTRILAVAAVQSAPAAPPARALRASWRGDRRVQRLLGVTAGALASVVAVGGVAAAGSQSLPGDPFYGVKRTTEALQLAAADDDLDKGTRHLQFAAARLDEVRGLVVGRDAASDDSPPQRAVPRSTPGEQERIVETFADMDGEVRRASQVLTSAYRRSPQPSTLVVLSEFSQDQGAELEQLLPVLPSSSRGRAAASLALVASVGAEARELIRLGACGPSCAGGPGAQTQPCDCPAAVPAPPDPSVAGPVAPAGAPQPGPATGQAGPAGPAPASPGGSAPSGPAPAGPAPAGRAPAGPAPAGPAPAGPVPAAPLPAAPGTPSVPVPTGPVAPAPVVPPLAPVPGSLPTLAPPSGSPLPLDLPAAPLPGALPGSG